MRGFAFIVSLALVACAESVGVTPANASSDLREWQTATGKPPSKAEFAALVAACEDRAKNSQKTESIDSCLAEFGLHRIQ
jgi:hypothetical protein